MIRLILKAAFVTFVAASSSFAAVSEKDVLVVGRVISLLENGPTKGTVTIGVVEAGEATRADAESILGAIGKGKTVGDITLLAVPVRYEQLDTTNLKILFIPGGMERAELDRIFDRARERKLVTVSTDDACLKIQKCAIVVTSSPAVDIRLSVAASAATNVTFGSTFRMIIKEVE